MENGGIWFSIYGPMVAGVASFDKSAALSLLKKASFETHIKTRPELWTGYWSFTDCLTSSKANLPYVPQWNGTFPVYCAHPHAWNLYSYFMIMKNVD